MSAVVPPATPWSKLRLPALVLAIALIVIGPFLLMRAASVSSERAWKWVNHTYEVEAQVQSLAADVRNLESAALGHGYGLSAELLQERIDVSRPRIEPGLAALEALIHDNPQQQVRLGMLRTLLGLRLAQVDRLLEAEGNADPEVVEELLTRYPIHRLIEEIVGEERTLLVDRLAEAEAASARAQLMSWVAVVAQLLLLGALTYFSLREMGRRIEAEGGATRAASRASVVLDTVREPIVLLDGQNRVVMLNAAFAELYGVEGDARGRPLAELGGGAWSDLQILRRLTDVLTRDRELWDFEITQRTAEDVERVMLLSARRMPLPDSEDLAVLVTASDISAQKINERQIRELNRQLEGKVEQVSDVNRELEAFSYSVSHDLRAPLRHIAGFADKLGRHLGDSADEKGQHYLEVISSSARRMSALIDDLLVYSRLGRSALRLQMVDVQSMVNDTRSVLDSNALADQPDHRIDWRIDHLPVVIADENMLRQVWLNLLGNAVKYSTRSEPAQIEIGYEQLPDGTHRFSVRDNGAGFDMKYAGKLFGVFQRLHSASEFPGTGIGLASVRRVLSRHGGRIWAESEPGQGATFHFTLPPTGDLSINATHPENAK
ncbi:CHASE3 domain-containing protein [Luteimonas sp. Y-2-2-4F]|nr:ATP-binding protein [Luteimonas sp. Y-2-2-4F]MCD9031164.1 CHASE3 domain-containing protein [Luteimonas sp. Y-2-2-4F]